MSPEFYATIGTGIVLAGIILTQSARLNSRIDRLEQGYAEFRERMAKFEGLLEGLREAIAGRRPPHPPAQIDQGRGAKVFGGTGRTARPADGDRPFARRA